jgi:methionyl-tRNA formyltransferase
VRLVFAGTPEVAAVSLRALLRSSHDVVAVVSRPDRPAGRGRRVARSPVATLADEAGLPVLAPERTSDPDFAAQVRALAPDCVPVVAYGGLIPASLLSVPAHGWVNLHFSLLPAWRGAAPVQRALIAGDDVTGATTFRLEEGLDTGPAYGYVTEPIAASDTSGDLLTRLAGSGARLLVATLDGIADGSLRATPQPADGVSYAPKLSAADARIDWTRPALHVDRLVRGCAPIPGAWTWWRGQRMKLGPIRLHPDALALPPGELAAVDSEVLVGTGSCPVALGHVAPAGRRWTPAADWARGARLTAGDRLGDEPTSSPTSLPTSL